MLMAWLAMAVLIIISIAARLTGYKLIPSRFQSAIEMLVEMLFGFFNSILQDEVMTRKFFVLPATIFIFLITANWMGILPGVGAITIQSMVDGHAEALPLFRSMNADVNMTLVVALISMITVQVVGISTLGILPYASKYFVAPWKDPIGTFVGLLELMGELSRVFAEVQDTLNAAIIGMTQKILQREFSPKDQERVLSYISDELPKMLVS